VLGCRLSDSGALVRISIDVGGTFTDAIAVDEKSGAIHLSKIPSTPEDPHVGFASSLGRLTSRHDISPPEVSALVHVTTLGSNMLLGQVGLKMPTCVLVTTRGFRDVLEIGRQNRPELYNVFFERPKPLVPRERRLEVEERIDSNGRVMTEVRSDELLRLTETIRKLHAQTVAVCFLNSFLNGVNERRVRDAISRTGLPVHLSSEVDPEHREYERTSTTVVNALLAPVVSEYLDKVAGMIREQQIRCDFQVLSSSGRLLDVAEAKRRPITVLESGPAAGVAGSAEIARRLGLRRIISFDMGGTTAKAGAIVDFTPLTVPEIEVGGRVNMGRAVKGSGYPVRSSSIDLAEVSAGGGTIISVDGGGLTVGPLSAGASPGPACYNRGGLEPTITDANLILGRLGTSLLGGELPLYKKAAYVAFERVARETGVPHTRLAAAALKIANVQMARAINIVSLERGMDPRKFALVSFGGAGPMHAAELAEQVGVARVVIPPVPGLFSALGMLLTDATYTEVRGSFAMLDSIEEAEVEAIFLELESTLRERLRKNDMPGKLTFSRTLDLRYHGQGYELGVQVGRPFDRGSAFASFERKHRQVYGFIHESERAEITAFRLLARVAVRKLDISKLRATSLPRTPTRRRVWFGERWYESTVCGRDRTRRKRGVNGPAIIEEYDSTIVVPPDWRLKESRLGCVLMEKLS
jgi:N-methylhydantoinase A